MKIVSKVLLSVQNYSLYCYNYTVYTIFNEVLAVINMVYFLV